ncbi:IclR family transcriptional regulator [Nonomuraea thailandensis]
MSELNPADKLVGSDRVLAVLAELARHPDGIGLEEMARAVASPKPTVHRALAALRRAGFAAQHGHGRYVLGDEFLRMAFAHHEARPDHVRVMPVLRALCERHGETAHYAVLDGHSVVYRSKLDPATGAVRLSSVVGGRNPAHCTAVGKVLLADALRTEDEVRAWAGAACWNGRPGSRSARRGNCTPSSYASASRATPPTTRRTSPASTAWPSPPT